MAFSWHYDWYNGFYYSKNWRFGNYNKMNKVGLTGYHVFIKMIDSTAFMHLNIPRFSYEYINRLFSSI